MAKTIVVEQFNITVIAPSHLPKPQDDAIQRTLRSRQFQTRLRVAVRQAFGRHSSLRKTTFRIER